MTRAQILMARWSLASSQGRISTRARSGRNVTLVRLTLAAFIGGSALRGRLVEDGNGILHEPHLGQREQERQGRFRSLVAVDSVHVQRIAAPATVGRIKLQPEIVPAEEPVERALSLLVPPRVGRGSVGFEAGRHHRLRLDGLLVEISARAAAPIKSIAADRSKMAVLGGLHLYQPA